MAASKSAKAINEFETLFDYFRWHRYESDFKWKTRCTINDDNESIFENCNHFPHLESSTVL